MTLEELRTVIEEKADEQYRNFHKGLLPGTERILGVRMPEIRKIAKSIAIKEGKEFLETAKEGITKEHAFHEEIMIEGLVIGYTPMSPVERFSYLNGFIPKICNWAICDCCCNTYKFMKKEQEKSWEFLQKYLSSREEYELRFGIVSLLEHFINDTYIDDVLQILSDIRHDGYYVKMAAAWALSVCYIKYSGKTSALVTENRLDDFTHNKMIQKICESFRVSREQKEELKKLKRKIK
ncbi:MAG: DNA alkylation repair protein [Schaedlerella sp.]|nr:DNA alkylation repair protein [Lachnospiraceae bacterium]MDY4202335.1 DNA alkylation repair protein [Schaedlerella sp.]